MARSSFRPCIDLHSGLVKQIVGASLSDASPDTLRTNHIAKESPKEFALLYRRHNLRGGHVIKLGPGNDDAARSALEAWPDALHIGGGITPENALDWISAGAEKVIVTSYLFPSGKFSLDRLRDLSQKVGRERLVVDVSCRKAQHGWTIAMNKWQDLTDTSVTKESLDIFAEYCSEFLIHAADVEGLCQGIDEDLVKFLGEIVKIPTTYAGGAKSIEDLDLVDRLSSGRVDLTYGSALDIFGGTQVSFEELAKRNAERQRTLPP
ncbi:hypothetical protein BS47DRAFT_1391748 [Hydnum rufescens UP504]|uniref:1-(5-phosphoribosyl)-5-[(5-phosphoribosylamino)methylideneamino] imidazole-4-carboxamide isomerase n=1 Tax=Hydnum rufescens UP504 TaxID=1448309 RepID=A0A9P6DVD4_9AGAM|nr:hypothetical protein BS47DRAFT_1391748 [Hydnum rufescens UP504]